MKNNVLTCLAISFVLQLLVPFNSQRINLPCVVWEKYKGNTVTVVIIIPYTYRYNVQISLI